MSSVNEIKQTAFKYDNTMTELLVSYSKNDRLTRKQPKKTLTLVLSPRKTPAFQNRDASTNIKLLTRITVAARSKVLECFSVSKSRFALEANNTDQKWIGNNT